MNLSLPEGTRDLLIGWSLEALPEEACGLVAAPEGSFDVARVWRCRNGAASQHLFHIEPGEVLAVMSQAEVDGLEVVGSWHSHPSGFAKPSRADLAQLPLPGWVHVMVAFRPAAHVRAWLCSKRGAEPVELCLVGG